MDKPFGPANWFYKRANAGVPPTPFHIVGLLSGKIGTLKKNTHTHTYIYIYMLLPPEIGSVMNDVLLQRLLELFRGG